MTFVEDRADVARRAMPRLAAGTGMWCLLAAGIIVATDREAPLATVLTVLSVVWLVALVTRFDVLALQFGRRIRYEMTADQFRAYRGQRLVACFDFSAVREWVAVPSASILGYWLGWGYLRSASLPLSLSQYSFQVIDTGSGTVTTVKPPALFRWADRGGLTDVTGALIERLGPPLNYSINYSLDR